MPRENPGDGRNIGALIVAGGKSTRMGKDKASLPYGDGNFALILAETLSGYGELLLSRANETQDDFGLRAVYDIYPDCGPIGGLHAALASCESEALLAVSCDTPMFEAGFGGLLCSRLESGYDAVVAVDGDRIHPLCAVYRKNTAPVFERCIKRGDYRLLSVLEELSVRFLDIGETGYSGDCLRNINRPEEYRRLADES